MQKTKKPSTAGNSEWLKKEEQLGKNPSQNILYMIVEICQSKRGFIMDGLIGGMLAGASGATCNVKFRVKYSKEDCFNSLKQALESIKGIKIFFENQEIGTISAKKKLSMFSY